MGMKIGKNEILLGLVGILFILVLVVSVLYVGVQGEVGGFKDEIDSLEVENEIVSNQFKDVSGELSTVVNFSTKYFSGWGLYYDTLETEDTAWWNYDRAEGYYDVGNWYAGVGYYEEAATYFMDARVGYQDALAVFQQAANYSVDNVWVNLSQQSISTIDSMMKAMTFIRETAEKMEDTCDAYLDGNYDTAHDYYDEAGVKYGYYEDQMAVFANFQDAFTVILLNYVI
jgi:tetratricopeptide (TPR) repeat protein